MAIVTGEKTSKTGSNVNLFPPNISRHWLNVHVYITFHWDLQYRHLAENGLGFWRTICSYLHIEEDERCLHSRFYTILHGSRLRHLFHHNSAYSFLQSHPWVPVRSWNTWSTCCEYLPTCTSMYYTAPIKHLVGRSQPIYSSIFITFHMKLKEVILCFWVLFYPSFIVLWSIVVHVKRRSEKAQSPCQRKLLSPTENTAPAMPDMLWSRVFTSVTYVPHYVTGIIWIYIFI